jgi:hypothetical protein
LGVELLFRLAVIAAVRVSEQPLNLGAQRTEGLAERFARNGTRGRLRKGEVLLALRPVLLQLGFRMASRRVE